MGFITLLLVALLLFPTKEKKMHEQYGADLAAEAAAKKANRITFGEVFIIVMIVVALGFGGLYAFTTQAQGAEVQVYRGNDQGGHGIVVEGGVQTFRGFSDYKSAPIMEPVKEPEVNSARRYFNEYDAWRKRQTHRRLHPRP